MVRTRLEVHDRIAHITIDDGKVNSMSTEMLEELDTRLEAAATGAGVTVLRGRPGIFSAGFDMPTFSRGAEPTLRMLGAGMKTLVRMLTHPHPIVVACTGHAFPMGAFLMMCADVRYGIRGDFKIGMNEVAIGLTVPRFALELAKHRLSSNGFARVSTGALFCPEEAVAMGYLDYAVREDELFAQAEATATALLSIDSSAYVRTKARMHGSVARTILELSEPSTLEAELRELSNA